MDNNTNLIINRLAVLEEYKDDKDLIHLDRLVNIPIAYLRYAKGTGLEISRIIGYWEWSKTNIGNNSTYMGKPIPTDTFDEMYIHYAKYALKTELNYIGFSGINKSVISPFVHLSTS